MSQRVPNCLLDAIDRQNWLKYTVSTENMAKHFGTNMFKINSGFFHDSVPLFTSTLGTS